MSVYVLKILDVLCFENFGLGSINSLKDIWNDDGDKGNLSKGYERYRWKTVTAKKSDFST